MSESTTFPRTPSSPDRVTQGRTHGDKHILASLLLSRIIISYAAKCASTERQATCDIHLLPVLPQLRGVVFRHPIPYVPQPGNAISNRAQAAVET